MPCGRFMHIGKKSENRESRRKRLRSLRMR
jgi:hypothetical protein